MMMSYIIIGGFITYGTPQQIIGAPGPSRIDAYGLQLTRQGVYRDTVHTATH